MLCIALQWTDKKTRDINKATGHKVGAKAKATALKAKAKAEAV